MAFAKAFTPTHITHLSSTLRPIKAKDPWAGGGYAHAPPGCADARFALASPERATMAGGQGCAPSLFFAGEVTAYHSNPQTGNRNSNSTS